MIELKWGDIRNPDFMGSLKKLLDAPMDFPNAQKFVLIGQAIKREQKMAEETHKKILDRFGTKDEKRPGFYNIPDAKQEEYGAEMDKLVAHTFKVRVKKMDVKVLTNFVKLSPHDMLALESILLPIEELAEVEAKEPQENKEAQAQPTAH